MLECSRDDVGLLNRDFAMVQALEANTSRGGEQKLHVFSTGLALPDDHHCCELATLSATPQAGRTHWDSPVLFVLQVELIETGQLALVLLDIDICPPQCDLPRKDPASGAGQVDVISHDGDILACIASRSAELVNPKHFAVG